MQKKDAERAAEISVLTEAKGRFQRLEAEKAEATSLPEPALLFPPPSCAKVAKVEETRKRSRLICHSQRDGRSFITDTGRQFSRRCPGCRTAKAHPNPCKLQRWVSLVGRPEVFPLSGDGMRRTQKVWTVSKSRWRTMKRCPIQSPTQLLRWQSPRNAIRREALEGLDGVDVRGFSRGAVM